MNEQQKQRLDGVLREFTHDRTSIDSACEAIGERLGQSARDVGVPREQLVNQLQTGIDRGFSGSTGSSAGSQSNR